MDYCPAQITTYRGDQYDHDGHVHPEESVATQEMDMKKERSGNSSLESPGKYFRRGIELTKFGKFTHVNLQDRSQILMRFVNNLRIG